MHAEGADLFVNFDGSDQIELKNQSFPEFIKKNLQIFKTDIFIHNLPVFSITIINRESR